MNKKPLFFLLALLIPVVGLAKEVAISIDDLPFVGAIHFSQEHQKQMFMKVLRAFDKYQIQASTFVIGGRVQDHHEELLDEVVRRGHIVGNHTFSHPYFKRHTVAEYKSDILKGEQALKPWMSGKKYFRYPMLHRGDTLEKKLAMFKFLAEQEYTIAPVSIDNDEWKFARDYTGELLAGNKKRALKIGKSYLAHMKERTQYFQNLAKKKLGRDVKHILLLHMNQLNSDYLPTLLRWYSEQGWKFITLEEALSDPLYSMEDLYVGNRGISYLERILL